jgi:hypothetical protein
LKCAPSSKPSAALQHTSQKILSPLHTHLGEELNTEIGHLILFWRPKSASNCISQFNQGRKEIALLTW